MGRLTVSAFAVRRDCAANVALKEAAALKLLDRRSSGGGGGKMEAWLDEAEPLALAQAILAKEQATTARSKGGAVVAEVK